MSLTTQNYWIKGDRVLWCIISLLVIFSFLPVFSASSNLAYVIGKGTPLGYLIKHFVIMSFGFSLLFAVHKVPYTYFKGISVLMMPVIFILLIYTASQGDIIGGANANRWIEIPIIGFSFQTSTLASMILMIYVANYMSKPNNSYLRFKNSFWLLWFPVISIVMLIFPSNFSTAVILLFMVITQMFIGGYPSKYLIYILGFCIGMIFIFFLLVKTFPEIIPNRIDTWTSRIENFKSGKQDGNYQIERAKIAIASGGVYGQGAGKSVMKNFLPQSSSDFIYAIIVEEYGLVGGVTLILLYLLLLFRIVVIVHKTSNLFGKLLVVGLGVPIVFQAFINIGVTLQVFPVTGQTLPLVSSGGTSAWMTFIALGVILSVSSSIQNNLTDIDNPLAILSEDK
jgi:cell division protein FtsW|tara:strand:+ start:5925 stop:7112 length:1188 start_codon:yes stop_codon:yes gene_type:complete